MPIAKLTLTNFRNLYNTSISLHPRLNIIYGMNASGKTSLLEAFYFASTGRSFRSRKIVNIVRRDDSLSEFILYCVLTDSNQNIISQVGIRKSTILPTEIRLNREPIKSASRLAKLSPIILIDPHSFELLIGPPAQRRQFMDWGVFHVEHSFSEYWNNYINCLKQRNSLLRNAKIDPILLNIWDSKLAEFGELIHVSRQAYFEKLKNRLKVYLTYFSLSDEIKISYVKGWDKSKSFKKALDDNKHKDSERKFTQFGPHRADIKLTINGQPAHECLSRGQQKLLIFALYLAQMETLNEEFNKTTVVQIDDVAAELDKKNLKLVFDKLLQLDAQVIVTILNVDLLEQMKEKNTEFKMFHVEHGNIKAIE